MSTVFSSLKIKIKILLFCCHDKLSYTRDHLVTDRGDIRIKQNNEKMLIITFLQWRNKHGALFPVITSIAECSGSAHSGRTFTVEGFGYQYKGTELNIKRTFSATTFPINQPHFINHLMRLDHSRHLWQLDWIVGCNLNLSIFVFTCARRLLLYVSGESGDWRKNDCTVRRLYHLFSGSISPKVSQAHDKSSLLDESEQVDYEAFSPPATKEEEKQSKGQRGWYDVFYN